MASQSKIRVALFSSEYPPHVYGGLGTHVSALTAALAGRVEFDLFVPALGDYVDARPGIRLHEVPVAPAVNNVEVWLNYCKSAVQVAERAALAVDLVHCHDWMTAVAGVKLRALLRKPLVYNIHLPQAFPGYKALEKHGLVNADLVLVNSRAIEQELNAYELPLPRVEVIPNGVDLDTFQPANDWPAGDDYVLFVGRLVAQKGVTHLLKALSVVLLRCPETRLVVAGDGELDLFLKRIARYLGIPHRVTFLDWTTGPDLVKLYQRARFVVVPSDYEPFGIVALEAMACGRPVIASRTGGLAEIVDDGVNGFLVEAGNHLQLAQRMVQLLQNDERREMGQAARSRAAEFSWDRVADQTLAQYTDLLARSMSNESYYPRIQRI
ncbi:MAG TPA: glycosyltransferase family 4 protein [Pyrinomonadaceae bacterium]|nr:glycosyltransferase family 4 protein [Pyrinomonadaceae bacterium]